MIWNGFGANCILYCSFKSYHHLKIITLSQLLYLACLRFIRSSVPQHQPIQSDHHPLSFWLHHHLSIVNYTHPASSPVSPPNCLHSVISTLSHLVTSIHTSTYVSEPVAFKWQPPFPLCISWDSSSPQRQAILNPKIGTDWSFDTRNTLALSDPWPSTAPRSSCERAGEWRYFISAVCTISNTYQVKWVYLPLSRNWLSFLSILETTAFKLRVYKPRSEKTKQDEPFKCL